MVAVTQNMDNVFTARLDIMESTVILPAHACAMEHVTASMVIFLATVMRNVPLNAQNVTLILACV